MASVPNRYFNSPWIADAARNLTDAMYPDEAKEEALAQSRYAFQQRVKADEQAGLDRQNQDAAAAALADILTAPDDATRTGKAAEAIRLNPQLTPQAFSALGTLDPRFMQKDALADQKNAAQQQMASDRTNAQIQMLGDRLAAMWGIANMRDDTTRRGQDISSDDRHYASDNALKGVQQRIAARQSGQQTPLRVSPVDMQNFAINAQQRAKQTGLRLDPARLDAVVNYAAELYQQGRNAGAALEQAFSELVPPDSYTEATTPGLLFGSSPTGVMAPLGNVVGGGAAPSAPRRVRVDAQGNVVGG